MFNSIVPVFRSTWLLGTDDSSCRKLLERLEFAASKFERDPIHGVCVATRWNCFMVQIALGCLVYEDTKVIQRNALLAELISDYLPDSKTDLFPTTKVASLIGPMTGVTRTILDMVPHGLEMYKMRESTASREEITP